MFQFMVLLLSLTFLSVFSIRTDQEDSPSDKAVCQQWYMQVCVRSIQGVSNLDDDVQSSFTAAAQAVTAIEIVRFGSLLAEKASEEAISTAKNSADWPLYQNLCVDYAMILDSRDERRYRLLEQALDCSTSVSLTYYSAVAALELLDSEDLTSMEARAPLSRRCVQLIAAHLDNYGTDWRGNALVNSLAYLIKCGRSNITLQDVASANQKVGDIIKARLQRPNLRKEIPEPVRCEHFSPDTVTKGTIQMFQSILKDGYSPTSACTTHY